MDFRRLFQRKKEASIPSVIGNADKEEEKMDGPKLFDVVFS